MGKGTARREEIFEMEIGGKASRGFCYFLALGDSSSQSGKLRASSLG